MTDKFLSDTDWQLGKVLKYLKPNPVGEDVYLDPDGVTIHKDEDKIVRAQRIFKHNYYKPGGRGCLRVIKRLVENVSGPAQPPPISK
jgi:hypothetical protein